MCVAAGFKVDVKIRSLRRSGPTRIPQVHGLAARLGDLLERFLKRALGVHDRGGAEGEGRLRRIVLCAQSCGQRCRHPGGRRRAEEASASHARCTVHR